jgi:hypothetical protein
MSRGRSDYTLSLVEAAQEILCEIEPATVRAVCYKLDFDTWNRCKAVEEAERRSLVEVMQSWGAGDTP